MYFLIDITEKCFWETNSFVFLQCISWPYFLIVLTSKWGWIAGASGAGAEMGRLSRQEAMMAAQTSLLSLGSPQMRTFSSVEQVFPASLPR